MTSFSGTISYEGDQPDESNVQEAIRLANSVRALKEFSGLPRIVKAYDLFDGGQVYVLDLENIWRVHIVQPFIEEEVELEYIGPLSDRGEPPLPIAGVLSGVGFGTTIEQKEVSWPDVGQEDVDIPGVPKGAVPTIVSDAFSLVKESADLFPIDQASYKLGVPLDTIFSTVGDTELRNQFYRVVPGQFTGAMAAIVQLLLGVGRIVFPDYEERWLNNGTEADPRSPLYPSAISDFKYAYQYDRFGVVHETGELLDEFGAPVESDSDELPETLFSRRGEFIQIDYDYRWNRTHGIVWGEGNDAQEEDAKPKPMLVELAQRGIHVMPFPVDELSTKKAVQDHYEKVYPKLKQYKPFQGRTKTLFEAFNGFPTGERIPGFHETFDRWKRAGKVIAAPQDLSEFYEGISMSTGFGWAFHPTQPRAINTAYKYENDHKIGYCYQVDLRIIEKPEGSKVRNPFFAETVAALGLTEDIDIFKAKRLPEDFAESMIDSPDYDAFDDFEVDPDWTVAAVVTKLREGIIDYNAFQCPLFDPCDIISSPHFKFYEPLIGEVFNFTFYNKTIRDEGREFVADGPIFATYKDSGVEILNYYYDATVSISSETFNTRQPCQYSGTWQSGTLTEGETLSGYFYCTSKDFRRRYALGGGNITTTSARGIGNADFIGFCAFFGIHSTSKKDFFGVESWGSLSWSGISYHVSATAAANNRSAFLVCREKITSGKTTGNGFSGRKLWGSSGAIKKGTIRNFIWHWIGCGDYECPSSDSPCRHRNCFTEVTNPRSCFGTEPPTDIQYSVCPSSGSSPVVTSPVLSEDGTPSVIVSAYYTPVPEAPPARSAFSRPTREFEWEVWAFGLDLLNNRKVNSGKEVFDEEADPQTIPRRSSFTGWWRCSLSECPAPQWLVGQNFFGKPLVSAYDDLDPREIVDFGAELSVGFGPSSVPFGIVD